MAQDKLVFDAKKLGRIAARRGLLRGDIGKLAGISGTAQCQVFLGRPVGVRTARKIANALGMSLEELIIENDDTVDVAFA